MRIVAHENFQEFGHLKSVHTKSYNKIMISACCYNSIIDPFSSPPFFSFFAFSVARKEGREKSYRSSSRAKRPLVTVREPFQPFSGKLDR